MTVTTPEGVTLSDNVLSGSVDGTSYDIEIATDPVGATVLAYLDDVATTVTENVVTIPLSTEEIEIVATDLEQGIISSYTYINDVTQTQYASFTIAVPSGVTVSGTTISGEVATETYTITVTPDPVASTVTAKIDNVETTVTANAFAVPVSATSVEITVVADGYVSATETYTNEVEQVIPTAYSTYNFPADVTVTGNTISGTISESSYDITIASSTPNNATVTATIDGTPTTITNSKITVPVSATNIAITTSATGYAQSTNYYTNTVTQAGPAHTVTFVVDNPSTIVVDNTAHTITANSGDFVIPDTAQFSVKVACDGTTVTGSSPVRNLMWRMYINNQWLEWTAVGGSTGSLFIPIANGVKATKVQAKYKVDNVYYESAEYTITAPTASVSTDVALTVNSSLTTVTVNIDDANNAISIVGTGESWDSIGFTPTGYTTNPSINYVAYKAQYAPASTSVVLSDAPGLAYIYVTASSGGVIKTRVYTVTVNNP